jgi:pimeloyl-ACP methyl ester carboxylesterase
MRSIPQAYATARAGRVNRPSGLLVALAACVLLLLALVPPTARTRHALAAGARPTIILVHGAWAGPGSWDDVVARLQKDGYATQTPTLALQSVAADVATVRAAIDAVGGPVILVGHSYGGFVISEAAVGRATVRGLVYTAAFAPAAGESLLSLGTGYAPPAALAHLVFWGPPPLGPTTIDPAFFREDFAQDLNPKLAARLAAAQGKTSLGILTEPAGPVAWHDLPSWYAISGADRMVDPALQRFMAQRMGATTVTFPAASHAGGFTHYAARFVNLIEDAIAVTQ